MLAAGIGAPRGGQRGKDSLAVWDLLLELGYRPTGCTSASASASTAARAATSLALPPARTPAAHDRPALTNTATTSPPRPERRRVPCSACGLSKRHLFDAAALDGGYDVVATGHNLDDEAAVLFGNTLRWDVDYLARQLPVLPPGGGFPKKVKPLVRLTERETAAWCIVRGIDYQVEECPMAAGNKHLGYKAALNEIERESPGTKAAFYLNFVERMAPLLAGRRRPRAVGFSPCGECGAPTTGRCAPSALRERGRPRPLVPVDVVLGAPRRSPSRGAA